MPTVKITREEIIERAAEIFREQGYHRTSMEDIGSGCGLHKGSLYHYFPGKRELMLEVLREYALRFSQQAHQIAYDTSMTPADRIRGILKASEKIFPGMNGCLMANTILETANTVPEFTPVIQEFFSGWIGAFTAVFKETHPLGEARKLAALSVADIEGGLLLMRVHQDRKYAVNGARQVLQRVT